MKTKALTIIEILIVCSIIGLIAAIFASAVIRKNSEPVAPTVRYDTATSQITIDGCQYLWVKLSVNDKEYLSLIHKGNCTNHVQPKAEQ